MSIDWAALGQVFGVSVGVTVGLVGLFTLGIVWLSRTEETPDQVAVSGGSAALARTGAYTCFALCAAAVAYGIWIIVN
ncbi:hypothetical protein [Wenjunlia tyrosinilytica]|uniref:Uncharacterized protein n=1 Tax=Wenjunlia tyrosinilytica TaxID=1544741 RepID=A0A918DRL7_9ACTN|nr:hypothetical protein [Wenjunlia tyrosinilytica]GGO81267.1 hypothetical protein GCM10012280_05090 [Wenjunlia tyrosinilytica]